MNKFEPGDKVKFNCKPMSEIVGECVIDEVRVEYKYVVRDERNRPIVAGEQQLEKYV